MRVKIIKAVKDMKMGEIVEVTPNVGFGLIDSGYAIVSKDMTESDYKTDSTDANSKKRQIKTKEK